MAAAPPQSVEQSFDRRLSSSPLIVRERIVGGGLPTLAASGGEEGSARAKESSAMLSAPKISTMPTQAQLPSLPAGGTKSPQSSALSPPMAADTPVQTPMTPRDRAKALIAQQSFEGYFPLSVSLAQILGAAFSFLQAKLSDLSPIAIPLGEEVTARLWATLLAIGYFERELRSEVEMWELVVEKAKTWIEGVVGDEAKKLEGLVSEVLDGLKG
jgi:hypothetical protein